jgi:hypothetical protein
MCRLTAATACVDCIVVGNMLQQQRGAACCSNASEPYDKPSTVISTGVFCTACLLAFAASFVLQNAQVDVTSLMATATTTFKTFRHQV